MRTPETRTLATLVESIDCRNDDINLSLGLKPGDFEKINCQSWIELSIPDDVGATVEIPFVTPNRFPNNGPPSVLVTINGRYAGDSGVQMDTGSVGGAPNKNNTFLFRFLYLFEGFLWLTGLFGCRRRG